MKSVVVIPFNIPWNWSTDYTNQTAFELAKKGFVVICYLYGDVAYIKDSIISKRFPKLVSRYSKNVYLVNPIYLLPFRRFGFLVNLNAIANIIFLRVFTEIIFFLNGCAKKIFWIFDPNLFFIYKYFGRKYSLIYDCVDLFAVGSRSQIKKTNINERTLSKAANVVAANSQVLKKHLMRYRKNVVLVPQGFRSNGFKAIKKYVDLKLKNPVIGFVGGINNRLDTSLLLQLIRNNPKWNFVLWGPVQKDINTGIERIDQINNILRLPNVKYGESKDKREIPGIISQFDIGIIPYDISQDFNKYCYPMKLFEYFYLGKPVVSTDILELRRFSKLVRIGNNYRDWQKILNNLFAKKWSDQNVKDEIEAAKENSWENKVSQIIAHI